MIKFKTLRGLAGYLVRQEGKMTAKKSRAKIGDAVQILNALCDIIYLQELADDVSQHPNDVKAIDILHHVAIKRAQKLNKK